MLTLVTDTTSPLSSPLSPDATPLPSPDTERALADQVSAEAAGFSLRPPVYALGTAVSERGKKNFRQSRRDFESLPYANDACAALATEVEAERRHDVHAEARSLRMERDGRLTSDLGSLPVTERAVEGLCRLVTPGGAGYLTACPPDLRAENLNHWLSRAALVNASGVTKPRQLTLRARQVGGGCEIYSVVGPRYAPLDIDVIATQLHGLVPADARAEVLYDGYRARISVLFHSNIRPGQCVAGEIFKAGVSITTADDGTGAIKVAAQVWRNLCRNLILIDHAEQATTTRHVGKNLRDVVSAGIARAMGKIQHFAGKWSEATVENVLERYGVDDVETIFRALVETRAVHVAGYGPDAMVERLQRAWDVEPGYSKTAIVNAVTRAAHTEEWRSWTTAEELERTAGELLYARVWRVERPLGDLA
jgi:hypothetical protein